MKKKILTILGLVSVALSSIGGTLALLTSEDSDYNTMTLENAKIDQLEYERNAISELVEFTQDKLLLPTTSSSMTTTTYNVESVVGKETNVNLYTEDVTNTQDKLVFVKNTGTIPVYYRTVIAVEAPVGAESAIEVNKNETGITWSTVNNVEIAGVNYNLLIATYTDALEANEVSAPSLLQVYMTKSSTNEQVVLFGEYVNVLVKTQAVQATGYTKATTALVDGFGEITTENHPWGVRIPVGTEAELDEGLDIDKGEVVLEKNITIIDKVMVPAFQESTLELNGHKILFNEDTESMLMLGINSVLTITGDGYLDTTGPWNVFPYFGTIIAEGGTYNFNPEEEGFEIAEGYKVVENDISLHGKATWSVVEK